MISLKNLTSLFVAFFYAKLCVLFFQLNNTSLYINSSFSLSQLGLFTMFYVSTCY